MAGSILKSCITGLALALLLGPAAPVAHASEPLEVVRIDGERLYDGAGRAYLLAGVRLVTAEEDARSAAAGEAYLNAALRDASLIFDGTDFAEAGQGENRYGERLGLILRSDGMSLQEELILRGLGVWSAMAGFPAAWRIRLLAAERLARLEKAGLWQTQRLLDANNPPKTYWRGQFVIARGVVRDVARTPARTYLNFGDDWKTDFTVAISAKARRKFEAGEWKLSELRDKSIMIRGPVRFYNGPYMEVDFTEQMEIEGAVAHE